MDQSGQQVQELEKLFHASKDILLTLSATPRVDHVCAMLALSKALMQMPLTTISAPGQSRKVVKAVSGRQGSQYSLLPEHELIYSEVGLRDFVIALPGYVDKSVDSVSWYVDQGRLNVVLKSNPAVPMQFDPKLFDPFYAGANFDVVCVLGVDNPMELGSMYRQDPGMFTELPVVSFSKSPQHTKFARVNIVDTSVSSVSELVYEALSAFNVIIEGDIAKLLLCGIEDGSELMQQATPRAQEIVQHLRSVVGAPLDVNTVRSQSMSMPLPIHPSGVLPPQGQPNYPQQTGYPNQQVPPPMPPMGYPPNGGYAGYPPPQQGYVNSGVPMGAVGSNVPPAYPPPAYGYPGQMPPVANPQVGYGQGGAYPSANAFSSYHAPAGPQGWQQPDQQQNGAANGYYGDNSGNRDGNNRV